MKVELNGQNALTQIEATELREFLRQHIESWRRFEEVHSIIRAYRKLSRACDLYSPPKGENDNGQVQT